MLVGHRVAERVERRVHVAQIVADRVEHVECRRALAALAEAVDGGQHVERRPQHDERAEDERDGTQRLPRPVLRPRLVGRLKTAESARTSSPAAHRGLPIPGESTLFEGQWCVLSVTIE